MKPQSWITGARRRAHQWGDRFKHRKTPQPVKKEDVESRCAGVLDEDDDGTQNKRSDNRSKQKRQDHDQQRETLMDTHQERTPQEPAAGEYTQTETADLGSEIVTVRKKLYKRYSLSLWRWTLNISNRTWSAVCKACVSLVQRPYFSRVWVMQEVFLAPKISICCGQHQQPMETLHALARTIQVMLLSLTIVLGIVVVPLGEKRTVRIAQGGLGRLCLRLRTWMDRLLVMRTALVLLHLLFLEGDFLGRI